MQADLEFALDLARGAVRILPEGFERLGGLGVAFKGRRNLVTEIDEASEAFIRDEIGKRFPDDRVLGELGIG